jgi:hypothetical protein
MTMGFYALIRKADLDFLADLFASRVTDDACTKLAKGKDMTLQDLLEIRNTGANELRRAVYTNTLVCESDTTRSNLYTGSTPGNKQGAKGRIDQHWQQIRSRSPKATYSAQYNLARQDGITSNFRVISVFEQEDPEGYILYLEAIIMAWANYFQRPRDRRSLTDNNPLQTHEWVEKLCSNHPMAAHLPNLGITGTNMAFPLYQGFTNQGSKRESPCGNPNCGKITKPLPSTPDVS